MSIPASCQNSIWALHPLRDPPNPFMMSSAVFSDFGASESKWIQCLASPSCGKATRNTSIMAYILGMRQSTTLTKRRQLNLAATPATYLKSGRCSRGFPTDHQGATARRTRTRCVLLSGTGSIAQVRVPRALQTSNWAGLLRRTAIQTAIPRSRSVPRCHPIESSVAFNVNGAGSA